MRAVTLKLTKSPPAGGKAGQPFDSGCNPSGVTKIHIECGRLPTSCSKVIKRIFMDFQQTTGVSDPKTAIYYGNPSDNALQEDKTFTFELGPNDQIIKAVVWDNGSFVVAVQFHTKLGIISPMIGRATGKPTFFQGTDFDSQLVGFYGSFGGVIDSLGFAFASFDSALPSSVGGSWAQESNDEHMLVPE